MTYAAKIIADSVSPHGVRLTTLEVTYPRMVHSELMTHRLNCGLKYEDEWGELPEDVARLAFLSDDEAQALVKKPAT